MRYLILLLGFFLSCANADVDVPSDFRLDAGLPVEVDAAVLLDAGVDAPAPGLPLDATCVPILEQCATGLTCRVRGAHDGRCEQVGPFPAGAICSGEDECGANMICMQLGWAQKPGAWKHSTRGVWYKGGTDTARCAVVCDVWNPYDRCQPGQRCTVFVGDDLGICQ